jgi:hypothetical protein
MAAKLKWNDDELMLGGKSGWTLGAVRVEGGLFRAVLNRPDGIMHERYEERGDAVHDLEAEVRRLLKAADVKVE